MSSVQETIKQRYSCRRYLDTPIPDEKLQCILEAGRLAPSACNRQPWRFGVIKDQATRKAIVTGAFRKGIRMDWALDAPVFIVIGMVRSVLTHRIAPQISSIDYPLIDIGITGQNMVLQATELGIQTCWIGWIRPRPMRRILNWPQSIKPVSLLTLGFAADPPPDPRPRLPLEELTTCIDPIPSPLRREG